jgi:hypothetical protein
MAIGAIGIAITRVPFSGDGIAWVSSGGTTVVGAADAWGAVVGIAGVVGGTVSVAIAWGGGRAIVTIAGVDGMSVGLPANLFSGHSREVVC